MKRTIVATALLAACTAPASPGAPGIPTLAGTEWGPADAPAIFVRFGADGQMSGSGGCNSLGASYVQDGGVLTIGPVRTTRKACDVPTMDREQAFLDALDATERVGVEDDGRLGLLVLKDANGAPLARLQRRDWD